MSATPEAAFPWSVLGIAATRETDAIKRAYATRLKAIDAPANPAAFQELRRAYEAALTLAAAPANGSSPAAPADGGAMPLLTLVVKQFHDLGMRGDTDAAMAVVERFTADGAMSTDFAGQLQARLFEAATDDPDMPPMLLGALAQRFRWDEVGSALEHARPDLHARYQRRTAAAASWYASLRALAAESDAAGAAARILLQPGAGLAGQKKPTNCDAKLIDRLLRDGRRHAPLLRGALETQRIETLYQTRRRQRTKACNCVKLLNAYIENTYCKSRGGDSGLATPARWALAVGAMYTLMNHGTDHTLAPFAASERVRSVNGLRDDWGVDGASAAERREQAIDVLNSLIDFGHRSKHDFADPGEREAFQDLLAWDMARAANVARHAWLAGYITREEAWSFLFTIAKKVQAGFTSWSDYGRRYVRGYVRWAGEHRDVSDRIVEFLIDDVRSPWRALDWRTDLSERAPVDTAQSVRFEQTQASRARRRNVFDMSWRIAVMGAMLAAWAALKIWPPHPAPALPPGAQAPFEPKSADEFRRTPVGEFAQIEMEFLSSGSGIQAQFRHTPLFHRVSELRFGIDRSAPDRTAADLTPTVLSNGFPVYLKLPPRTRFVTLQARLEDGSLSPIRRFDVPTGIGR